MSEAELGFKPASTDFQFSAFHCTPESTPLPPCGAAGEGWLGPPRLADCMSGGSSDPSMEAHRARQRAGRPAVLSSARLLLRLIAACPQYDVSLFRLRWEGWEPCSHADGKPVGTAGSLHRALIGQRSISGSRTASEVQLPSWHLCTSSGVTGPLAQSLWAGPVCLPRGGLSGGGEWEPGLTAPFALGVLEKP